MKYSERRKAALREASSKANRLHQLIQGIDCGGPNLIYRLVGDFLGLKSPEHGRPRWGDKHGPVKFDGWHFVLTLQERTKPHHPSGHRLYVVCPDCNAVIPVGRFHQHLGTKVCLKARAEAEKAMSDEAAAVWGDSVVRQ